MVVYLDIKTNRPEILFWIDFLILEFGDEKYKISAESFSERSQKDDMITFKLCSTGYADCGLQDGQGKLNWTCEMKEALRQGNISEVGFYSEYQNVFQMIFVFLLKVMPSSCKMDLLHMTSALN